MAVQTYPALLHTGYCQEIKNQLLMPVAFNHCMAWLRYSYRGDPTGMILPKQCSKEKFIHILKVPERMQEAYRLKT